MLTTEDTNRIAGRQWADEVLILLEDSTDAFRIGFWRRIKKELSPKDIDSKAMTDEEAREFGTTIVDFGQYQGRRMDDMPLDYLEWLTAANAKMQRYLRSRRIMAETDGD